MLLVGVIPINPLCRFGRPLKSDYPFFSFFLLQLHTLAFTGYRMQYLVESKLICTAWYFAQAMLCYDIDWHSRKSWYEKNVSTRLFKPSWDTARSAHEEFTQALLM